MRITPEMVNKAIKGLEAERTVEELAQYVGCTRSEALDIMDYLTRTGRAQMVDYQKRKWALRYGVRE